MCRFGDSVCMLKIINYGGVVAYHRIFAPFFFHIHPTGSYLPYKLFYYLIFNTCYEGRRFCQPQCFEKRTDVIE